MQEKSAEAGKKYLLMIGRVMEEVGDSGS